MRSLAACGLLLGLLAACHGTDMGTPDAGQDGDAGPPGLFVRWATNPSPIPGDIEDSLAVDDVQLVFDNLRVIGDAGPGDPRTSQAGFDVRWSDTQQPELISFPDAPSGLYSKVSFALDGHTLASSYRILGHVTLNGTTYPFEIEDHEAMAISLDVNRTLAPGQDVTIGLILRLRDALDTVDFEALPVDGGRLELETLDPQMPAFRAKLTTSFEVDNSGPN